ncbi:unnamed protein product [Meganyctiphanes norvegica]|uniref:Reverse transcriptase domain-containing protein n=1 Tax=Meganyctiphanes norvegica TaxID=48144 RepID=A0AAV2S3P4_MEGNR
MKVIGKLSKWIREFLKDRMFVVVANGCMSEEEEVLSGVPQGTVFAPILFVMMISNIDENVKDCIVRTSFADDTRVRKKNRSDEDKEIMQEDLDSIYKWASENLTKFNANKFEQMAHGNKESIDCEPYKSPTGD